MNEQALLVHGVTSEKLGDLAFAAGVPIHELVAEGSSLEDVFLELTTEPRRSMIAQTQAELLKIRSTRTTIGIVLGMIALILLFSLLSGLLTKPPHLTSTRISAGCERGQHCRGILGAGRDHARDERVSLRHDPPDLPLHPAALAGSGAKLAAGLLAGSCSASSVKGSASRSVRDPHRPRHRLRVERSQTRALLLGRWPASHSAAPSASASA